MHTLLLNADALAAQVRVSGAASIIDDAVREGVAGLLAYTAGPDLDPQLNALRRRLMLEEDLRAAEMRRVVAALGAAGIRAVILKGSALAYTHYPEPWCRTRADLDLLVAHDQRLAAGGVLAAMGYARGDLVSGTWVMQQDLWERRLLPGDTQMVDVHVEFSNRALFTTHFPAANGLAHAIPAPFAGPYGWQLDAVDALLFSCVHRVAHHSGDARLIWICDLQRQAIACTTAELATLIERATRNGLASICAQELATARTLWGGDAGALSDHVIATLRAAGTRETSRGFLANGRGFTGDVWLDLRALPGWRARTRLIAEHLFPSRVFMLRQPGATPRNLPWRYARRIVAGLFKWIAR